MGAFVFFIFIFIVIFLIKKVSKLDNSFSDKLPDKNLSTDDSKILHYNDDDILYDADFYDENDYDDDNDYESTSVSKNSSRSFFDRMMDSTTPESAFVKGLEDEGYDVENW